MRFLGSTDTNFAMRAVSLIPLLLLLRTASPSPTCNMRVNASFAAMQPVTVGATETAAECCAKRKARVCASHTARRVILYLVLWVVEERLPSHGLGTCTRCRGSPHAPQPPVIPTVAVDAVPPLSCRHSSRCQINRAECPSLPSLAPIARSHRSPTHVQRTFPRSRVIPHTRTRARVCSPHREPARGSMQHERHSAMPLLPLDQMHRRLQARRGGRRRERRGREEEEEEMRRETGREWGRCSMKKRRRRGEGRGEGRGPTLQCVYVVCVVSGAVYVQF